MGEDEVVVSIESDKMGQEIRSTHAGEITEVMFAEGKDVKVGEVLFKVDTTKAAIAEPITASSTPEPVAKEPTAPAKAAQKPVTQSKTAAVPPPEPVRVGSRNENREPITPIRQKVQNAMKESQNTAACLTTFQECNMSEVINLQTDLSDEFSKRHGMPLSFLSFFVMAASRALQEFGIANSSVENNEIIHRDYVDIGVTLATPSGSVTPVIHNVESKKFKDIETHLSRVSDQA